MFHCCLVADWCLVVLPVFHCRSVLLSAVSVLVCCSLWSYAGVCCRWCPCLAAWPAALFCVVFCCGALPPCAVFCGAVCPCGAVLGCRAVSFVSLAVFAFFLLPYFSSAQSGKIIFRLCK